MESFEKIVVEKNRRLTIQIRKPLWKNEIKKLPLKQISYISSTPYTSDVNIYEKTIRLLKTIV